MVDDVSLGERSDRTADFIGLLPVTRKQIILSKWLISIIVLAGCAAFHSVSVRSSYRESLIAARL